MSRNKAIWLARLLFRRGQLTKDEILEAWSRNDESAKRMAPSTFYDNRHLLEERYGIRLRCESGYYSLDLHDGREHDFMRQLFSYDGLKDGSNMPVFINEPEPAGQRFVATFVEAVEERLWTVMTYAPFDKAGYTTDFAPYCMRTFRGRCYVVGYSERHREFRTFATDRMTDVTITDRTYRMAREFNAKRYFANSFGAYGGMDLGAEHIVIEAGERAAAYLRTRELHSSQRETTGMGNKTVSTGCSKTKDGDTGHAPAQTREDTSGCGKSAYGFRFELDMAVSADFVRELLYYGKDIRIVSPESLQEMVRDAAAGVAALYGGATGKTADRA